MLINFSGQLFVLFVILFSYLRLFYFIFFAERKKRMLFTTSGEMFDRRSEIIWPAALNKRSSLANAAGTIKIWAATFDNAGRESAIVFQNWSMSLEFVSRRSNLRYGAEVEAGRIFDSPLCFAPEKLYRDPSTTFLQDIYII